MKEQDLAKKQCAIKAVRDNVKSHMSIGLGTGSTVFFVLEEIKKLLESKSLENMTFFASSIDTEEYCLNNNIEIHSLSSPQIHKGIDLYLDGADEIDSEGNLIKGGGGALLREKLLAYYAKKFIVLVDQSKLVNNLGIDFALPIEVSPCSIRLVEKELQKRDDIRFSIRKALSRKGYTLTDNHNFLIDVFFKNGIKKPIDLEQDLLKVVGVVETGIFNYEQVNKVYIGYHDRVEEKNIS